MSEYTPFKMKGSGFYGKGNQSPAKAHKPGHEKGTRKQDVTKKDYIIQDVSKIQENKKGKFITGLDDGSFPNNTSKDTTYLPPNMKHYSGKEYKKGDYMDETDFDEKIGKKPKKKSPTKHKKTKTVDVAHEHKSGPRNMRKGKGFAGNF